MANRMMLLSFIRVEVLLRETIEAKYFDRNTENF